MKKNLFPQKISAVIIDDEPDCVRLLSLELERHCPEVKVSATSTDSESGLKIIQSLKPELVFLDIEMPRMNGFELLEQVGDLQFSLVFTTAYDQFAVKAFKYSAIDYLLKPIDADELKSAVAKTVGKQHLLTQQLEVLRRQLEHPGHPVPEKIAFPSAYGHVFIEVKSILYFESDGNYTKAFLATGEVFLVSRNIGEIENLLSEMNFFRVHKQFLIHKDRIKELHRNEGNYVIMEKGALIPIARSRLDAFKRSLVRL